MDTAFLSSLTIMADDRTPEQHFTWYCLSPKPSGKSVLAELVGIRLANEICYKVLTPVLRRGKVPTPPAPSAASDTNPPDATKLSRRQKAKMAGKTKIISGSNTQDKSMSDGVSERSRCSDPGKQSPACLDESVSQTPEPSTSTPRVDPVSKEDVKTSVVRKAKHTNKRPPDAVSTSTAPPPAKVRTYEIAPDGTTTSNTVSEAYVTDEDLRDIIIAVRRIQEPAARGRFISEVLSQCSRSSAVGKAGAPQELCYTINTSKILPDTVPPDVRSSDVPRPKDAKRKERGNLPRGQPAPVSAGRLQRSHPMYRHLAHGPPLGYQDQESLPYGY